MEAVSEAHARSATDERNNVIPVPDVGEIQPHLRFAQPHEMAVALDQTRYRETPGKIDHATTHRKSDGQRMTRLLDETEGGVVRRRVADLGRTLGLARRGGDPE